MSHQAVLRATTALGLALSATAAHANLTAEAVWEAWQAYSTASGQTLAAGSQASDGGTLKVQDVTISTEMDEGDAAMTIGEMTFVEQDDGTVLVTMSDSYRIAAETDDAGAFGITVTQPGMRIVVAESPTGLEHAITAPELTIALEPMPGGPDMTIAALGVSGTYDIPAEPGGPISGDLGIRALNIGFEMQEAFNEVEFDYAATGVRVSFAGAGLDGFESDDPGEALRAGLSVDLGMEYDSLRYTFDMTEFGEQTSIASNTMSGTLRFVMNAAELSFSTSSRNGELTVSGAEIPFPELTVTSAQTAFGILMPVLGSAEPQDFSMVLRLVDVTVPEDVWMMFDPGRALVRSPLTAILDLGGRLVLPFDLTSDETAMGAMMGGPMEVAQLDALDLHELRLSFGGAELTGDGGMVFDNTDFDTFPGFPRPAGTVNLALRGGNALLDALVGMGLIPEEDAGGARMMMALFARPGDGPDHLVSTIEVTPDGALMANGMRLQ